MNREIRKWARHTYTHTKSIPSFSFLKSCINKILQIWNKSDLNKKSRAFFLPYFPLTQFARYISRRLKFEIGARAETSWLNRRLLEEEEEEEEKEEEEDSVNSNPKNRFLVNKFPQMCGTFK